MSMRIGMRFLRLGIVGQIWNNFFQIIWPVVIRSYSIAQNGRLQKHVPGPGKGIKYSDHNIRILLSYTIANVFINKILSSQPVSVVRITNHQAASRKENRNNQ